MLVRCSPLLALFAMAALPAGRNAQRPDAHRGEGEILLHFTTNAVTLELVANAPVVRLENDLFVTLTTTSPAEQDIVIPPAREVLSGFDVMGEFDELPVVKDGRLTRRRRVHLRPRIAAAYPFGPIPVTIADHSYHPPFEQHIMVHPSTPPLSLPVSSPPPDILVTFDLLSPPAPASRATQIATLVVLLVLMTLPAIYLRATPAQPAGPPAASQATALEELNALMKRDLLTQGAIEEFYSALTDIVRRHLETTHAIMAPEQTTEELLNQAARDPRFAPAFIELLRRFFREADGVKFAARRPPAASITREVSMARQIIEPRD